MLWCAPNHGVLKPHTSTTVQGRDCLTFIARAKNYGNIISSKFSKDISATSEPNMPLPKFAVIAYGGGSSEAGIPKLFARQSDDKGELSDQTLPCCRPVVLHWHSAPFLLPPQVPGVSPVPCALPRCGFPKY
eukprot:scaffold1872_cov262-Amphora_coffeaeformis.AAC.1